MGYYNVVKPCVVGKFHYARPTTQPIEVDDEVAAPLVEDGSLEPYGPRADAEAVEVQDNFIGEMSVAIEPDVEPEPRARRPRRSRED